MHQFLSKKKNYSFDHRISTDCFSVSIQLIYNDHIEKKKEMMVNRQMAKQVAAERRKDMTREEIELDKQKNQKKKKEDQEKKSKENEQKKDENKCKKEKQQNEKQEKREKQQKEREEEQSKKRKEQEAYDALSKEDKKKYRTEKKKLKEENEKLKLKLKEEDEKLKEEKLKEEKLKEENEKLKEEKKEECIQIPCIETPYIEFPYFDKLSKDENDELKKSEWLVVDPGKRCLLYMKNEKGKTLRYTNKKHVNKTKRLKYQKLIENYKEKQGIKKIESKLCEFNSKTCSLEKFKEFIKKKE